VRVAIDDRFQLGVMLVNHGFFAVFGSTSRVVRTGVTALEAGRIDGRELHATTLLFQATDRDVEQALDVRGRQQPLAGLVQRAEMGNLRQTEFGLKIGEILQHAANAAIVGVEESLQDQTGEQLRLRVDLWTVSV
jgi:hypothetical protein